MKNLTLTILLLVSVTDLFPQEDQKKISLNGYASSVMSSMFRTLPDPFINDYLIHNRLNFKGYLSDKFTVAAEFRNRLFTGDMAGTDLYASLIEADEGLVDMSWNVLREQSFFLNTTIDRLWLDWNTGKFQATIGRQRINWGQALVWNPNDIFNAYSYFDFDYIERPGSDALRLQYYTGASSAIELAVKADAEKEVTVAALYRFNKWSYDFQFLAGVVDDDELVAGTGWSGALGSVSFRGEISWFQPVGNPADPAGTGLFTAGADKIFDDNSMLQIQAMYSNNPVSFNNFDILFSEKMTVKDLAFSEFSAFTAYSYPVTPLFTAGISAMWFPDLKGYFTGLSTDYSFAENVDFSLLWQRFNGTFGSERTKINIGFLRFKVSF